MKQYDKVYVPDWKDKESDFRLERTVKTILCGSARTAYLPLTQLENVIVLTLEEAKELWMAGFNRADPENSGPAPTFQSYIQSKGITL